MKTVRKVCLKCGKSSDVRLRVRTCWRPERNSFGLLTGYACGGLLERVEAAKKPKPAPKPKPSRLELLERKLAVAEKKSERYAEEMRTALRTAKLADEKSQLWSKRAVKFRAALQRELSNASSQPRRAINFEGELK